MSLADQQECLEHLLRCRGFLYVAEIFRVKAAAYTERLLSLKNNREIDIELKARVDELRDMERMVAEAVEDIRDKAEVYDNVPDIEKEL